ncbi:MAG: electron transfer flavoprotein beta subunit/FixA family protein, partial [Bacteroidota bacterium]
MKLLVCVSKTPDTTTKIAFTGDNTALDTGGVQYIMNPYDEWYALVRALELKEAAGGSVTIINVGSAANDPVIRKGLAIGADEAVRIDKEGSSSLDVAQQIAAYAKDQGFDIVFFGKETIDYNGSEVGAMVAELLD